MEFPKPEDVLAYYEQDKDGRKVVIFEGVVYDVKEYMPEHPGGIDYLEKNLGRNIEEQFKEAEHTNNARKTLLSLPVVGKVMDTSTSNEKAKDGQDLGSFFVGEKLVAEYSMDYDKPLVWQLFTNDWTYKEYSAFINEPKILLNPMRDCVLFSNPVLEFLCSSYWQLTLLIWGSHVCYQSCFFQLGFYNDFAMIVIGFCTWSLYEYFLHRFGLHGDHHWMNIAPESKVVMITHFIVHGCHHAFPNDRKRNDFPPIPGYFLNKILCMGTAKMVVPAIAMPSFETGFVFGYVTYQMIHFYVHHGNYMNSYMREMKMYHMQHHYKFNDSGYGVSLKFWDGVFGTKIETRQNREIINDSSEPSKN